MTERVINWSAETSSVLSHIARGGANVHVLGGAETRGTGFLENVLEAARIEGFRVACLVDPESILTGTPPAALQELARNLGVPSPTKPMAPVSVSIGDKAHSKGDMNISEINVLVIRDEGEATAALILSLSEVVQSSRRFDRFILAFRECHRMSDDMRVQFVTNFWKPIALEMVKRGAAAIFQYSPAHLTQVHESIPLHSANRIELPARFDYRLKDEIATLILDEGWEDSKESALSLAKGMLDLSDSVDALYTNLLKIEIERTPV